MAENTTGNATMRRPGLRVLAAATRPLTAVALRRRGFFEAVIVNRWRNIVGEEHSGWCVPDRISYPRGRQGATLHLLVPGARATELQHLEPLILERVNTTFGYDAIARIAILQGPVPQVPVAQRRTERPLAPVEEHWLSDQTRQVRNSELKAALEALGRAVLASE